MLSLYKVLIALLICNVNLISPAQSPQSEDIIRQLQAQNERLARRKRELKDQNKVLTTENTELKAQLESRKQRIAELTDANKVLNAQLEDYWTIFDDKTRLLDVNKRLRQQYEPQTGRSKLVSIDV